MREDSRKFYHAICNSRRNVGNSWRFKWKLFGRSNSSLLILLGELEVKCHQALSVNHFAKLACQGNPGGSTIRFDLSRWQSQQPPESVQWLTPMPWPTPSLSSLSVEGAEARGGRNSRERKDRSVFAFVQRPPIYLVVINLHQRLTNHRLWFMLFRVTLTNSSLTL